MKNVILPAKAISAAILCQAKNDVRYYLCGVRIDKKYIISTDGHVLFRCDHSDFCNYGGQIEDAATFFFPRRPPAKAEYAVINTIDKHRGIIDYYKGCADMTKKQKPDGECHVQSDVFSIIDGTYPDTERLFERGQKAVKRVGVSGLYLGLAEKVFRCVDTRYQGTVMQFSGENEAILMRTRDNSPLSCEMLIMPMRA